jgi:dimethylargininase
MHSFTAFVRPPGTGFPKAISEHPKKKGIDLPKALTQHQSYVNALENVGGKIFSLPPEDLLPDSTFVEDTAFVFGRTAFMCSAKEKTRRNEAERVAQALKDHLKIVNLEPHMDGGDILNTPDAIYIGLSKRSNERAIQSLSQKIDKKVVSVPVFKGLHLKSAVSYLGNNVLLIDQEKVESGVFKSFQWIEVEDKNSYAANCLALGNQIIMPSGFPTIREKILQYDFETLEVEMSEFEKADGGVTCLSIILSKE